jgi:DNA-binding MarR family transcriptional regulator
VPGTDHDQDGAAVTSALLTASRVLVAVSVRSLSAAEDQVTLPQFRLLVVLDSHGETKLVALAGLLGVNSSTALRMVDRLTAAGFVSRRPNPKSRREVLLQLTKTGQQIVDAVTARRREEISTIVAKMAVEDRAGLVTALHAFACAGGELPAEELERDLLTIGWE